MVQKLEVVKHSTDKVAIFDMNQIDMICINIAANNYMEPTELEKRRAEVYRDKIIAKGEVINAGGFTVRRIEIIEI